MGRRRSAGKLAFYHVYGHVETEKQIGQRRYHVSYASAEEAWGEIAATLEARMRGISVRQLLSQVAGAAATSELRLPGPRGPIRFDQFCNEVFPRHRERMAGWRQERERVAWFIAHARFSNRAIHSIGQDDVLSFYRDYVMRPEVTSDNTRGHMAKAVRAVFRVAKETGYLRADPSLGVKIPSVPPSRRRALHLAHARLLCRAADPIVQRWILMSLYTGLRPREIERFTTANVDLSVRFLHVTGETVKNRSREIYIHDDLLPVLQETCSSVGNLPLLRDAAGRPQRFPRRRFNLARRAARLEHVDFYELRHTFASWLLEYGTESEEIRSYLMGHSEQGMTSRYTHVSRAKIRQAIERLPSISTASDGAEEVVG